MSTKKVHPSIIATSVLVGVLMSGYLASQGANSAGHDPTAGWPFPDLTGAVIFILGALVCPVLAFCLVRLLARMLPKLANRSILATLVFLPLMAYPMGAAAYRWHFRAPVRDLAKEAAFHQAYLAKNEALVVRLISNPEIALRERWFEWKPGNERLRYLFTESLRDSRVPYSATQLARIYQEAPEARVLVVAHPACDPSFLADHWSRAFQEADAGNREILTAIASNPKTPHRLLEELESSPLISDGGDPDALRQVLDTRLHGDKLVMTRHQMIKATTAIGPMRIHAGSDMERSCEWKNATRSATLKARKESSPDGPVLYFHGFSENSFEYRVTKRIEFSEGRRDFQTIAQAVQWIRLQSDRIPTVYRNDGLLVSIDTNRETNQLTVEVWQILINANKPETLPGADDARLTLTDPVPIN